MMKDKQSAWAKSFTLKDQATIIKRLLPFAKPYKKYFMVSFVFALFLGIVNVFLPQLLQYYIVHVLTNKNAGWNLILALAALYFIGTIINAITQFIQAFAFSMGAEYTLEN